MYLASTGSSLDALDAGPDIGQMTQPRSGVKANIREGRWWGCDCDAFGPRGVELERFLDLLESLRDHSATCLFITVPDHPGDGMATFEQFDDDLMALIGFGFPLAYVLQDGCETLPIPEGASAVFLGGTDPWREQWAATLLTRAKRAGLHRHVGRVNSARRSRALGPLNAQSVDGTYLRFAGATKQTLRKLNGWMQGAVPLLTLE
ncbi:hypothetical protein [Deinococcus ruber]|uniref:Uncharacterized protein n=1 Tax=Deinococcus ruber TaxID=1848197 RepID=A0A918CBX1_9DEIO|nr:hypothetical protein [Deinococcus ruber]GGR15826.1 hypothetical protein GCM10008957_30710 [Deinococcus ruber]